MPLRRAVLFEVDVDAVEVGAGHARGIFANRGASDNTPLAAEALAHEGIDGVRDVARHHDVRPIVDQHLCVGVVGEEQELQQSGRYWRLAGHDELAEVAGVMATQRLP